MDDDVFIELTKEEKLIKFNQLGKLSETDDGKIITDENLEEINVVLATYHRLLLSGGGYLYFILIQIVMVGFTYTMIQADLVMG